MIFPLCVTSYSTLTSYAYIEDPYENHSWEELPDEEKYNMWYRIRLLYDYIIKESYEPDGGGKLKENEDLAQVKSDMEEVKKNTNVDVEDTSSTLDKISEYPSTIGGITSKVWDIVIDIFEGADISTALGSSGHAPFAINPTSSAFTPIIQAFKIFAYSIVLLFFAVNIIEQSVKYEIFTLKGSLQIFGRLLIAKLIIDMSTTICVKIIEAVGYLIKQLHLTAKHDPSFFTATPHIELAPSKIKIIGPLIDSYVGTYYSFLILIMVVALCVMSLLVLIKLVLRSFELTMLVCTSPVFFACASSDVTKEYFKRFMVTFIQVAAQTVFMSLALYIGMAHLNSWSDFTITNAEQLKNWAISATPNVLIFVAMCIMMIKPPKVLTGLLKG